jgi:hypothetical protein
MKPSLRLALAFLGAVAVVTGVGFGFDRLLVNEGVPRTGVLLASNLLTALVAGTLFLQSKIRAQEKQKLLEHRLQKIAEMNHHVRNALQVVSFYRHQISDPEAARLLQDSISRIEWTLEEVLPRGWDLDRFPPQKKSSESTPASA